VTVFIVVFPKPCAIKFTNIQSQLRRMLLMKRFAILMLGLSLITGCATQPMTKTQKGAMIGTGGGAAAGAILGQAIGRNTSSTLIGAAVGAAVGGLTGGLVGNYMDKQEAEMRQALSNVEGAAIQREQDVLAINFKSDVMFGKGSATVKGGAQDELDRVGKVLNRYPETSIQIAGYTDSTGSAEVNQKLSEKRAHAVSSALVARNVNQARISTVGYGENRPIADNDTEAGRMMNRRVTITIVPNQQ
jgi:outer membrane protein OmpA-like peptidoglycan-associated protein